MPPVFRVEDAHGNYISAEDSAFSFAKEFYIFASALRRLSRRPTLMKDFSNAKSRYFMSERI